MSIQREPSDQEVLSRLRVTHLLVGERKNLPRWRPAVMEDGPARLRLLLGQGAFLRQDGARLYDHGVRWSHSMNLTWPDSQSVPFDLARAKDTVRLIGEHLWTPHLRVVWMCGKKVIRAFGHRDTAYGIRAYSLKTGRWELAPPMRGWFEMQELSQRPLMVGVPHPSGRCRVWNDVTQTHRVSEYCDAALRLSAVMDDEPYKFYDNPEY